MTRFLLTSVISQLDAVYGTTLFGAAGPYWLRLYRPMIVLLLLVASAGAQEVAVGTQEPPHYVGEPMIVQLQLTGFERNPEPTSQIQTVPAGLTAQLASVAPQVSRQMSIINGRRTTREEVSFLFNYQVRAAKPGQYTLGPFVVTQDGKQARAEAITLNFREIDEDPDMRVRLVLPSQPVFFGQRVPIRVELWVAGQGTIQSVTIHSPLFDRFTFIDQPAQRGDTLLPLQTAKGAVEVPATRRVETADGRQFVVFSAERILVPNSAGEFQFEPITASMRRVARSARTGSIFDDMLGDAFGGGSRRTTRSRAVGQPAKLVVKPLPSEGRPDSFAGAVGPGYTINVDADRTVVRVGDPIRLDVTLRGQGNLEHASLPPLSADGGMDPQMFRLPQGEVPGEAHEGEKRFSVSVRVNDQSVREIPALAYSWFDPQDQTYHTTRSKPIALRVTEAHIVSADDVVLAPQRNGERGSSSTAANDNSADSGNAGATTPSSAAPAFSLSGADLSIESNTPLLLSDVRRQFGGNTLPMALYGTGLLLVVIAVLDRKRRDIPPEIVRRRKTLKKLRTRIDRAAGHAQHKAASEIADALRGMVAEVPNVCRDDVQSVLAQCETIIYAPSGTDSEKIDSALVERAATVADEIIREAE